MVIGAATQEMLHSCHRCVDQRIFKFAINNLNNPPSLKLCNLSHVALRRLIVSLAADSAACYWYPIGYTPVFVIPIILLPSWSPFL